MVLATSCGHSLTGLAAAGQPGHLLSGYHDLTLNERIIRSTNSN